MRAYRVEITSWTASFKYPNIISGYQPTLHVPPLSMVLGLINACAGHYLNYKDEEIGYYFEYESKGVDLETIYQIGTKNAVPHKAKSNVLRREFLFNCRLYIYKKNPKLINAFKHPRFQLMLGRSCDLATVEEITERELLEKKNANHIRGQIVPFTGNYLPGVIQALPLYFTKDIPRINIGTQPFSVVSHDSNSFKSSLTAYMDIIDNKEVDILFHNIHIEQ